jgi:S1-C subfamily serine protease
MKRTLVLMTIIWFFSLPTQPPNMLTGKEIYRINCGAVVQIKTEEGDFGVGFLVSSDGKIMTANHVVTTRDSRFRQYATGITVSVAGQAQPYDAHPLTATPSGEAINYDSAVIKIKASNLPYMVLGNWDEVEVGDSLTILPSFPNLGCLLLQGIVSAKVSAQTDFGPKPVNTILFQTPIRNGFSGSPIFSRKGHVIGIQDTKVFGISTALDSLRAKWKQVSKGGITIIGGGSSASLPDSFIELIDNLDQNLISGLGSGVDIGYAKKQWEETRNAQQH